MLRKNKGQIWIETVLYTLIGLALIGIVLAIITPRINESKDRSIVEQSITTLNLIDSKINEVVEGGGGNVRNIDSLTLKRGELYINASNNSISIEISDLTSPYSQVGVAINFGRTKVLTRENGRYYSVKISIEYGFDLKYDGTNNVKKFTSASLPYRLSIENIEDSGGNSYLNINEISGR